MPGFDGSSPGCPGSEACTGGVGGIDPDEPAYNSMALFGDFSSSKPWLGAADSALAVGAYSRLWAGALYAKSGLGLPNTASFLWNWLGGGKDLTLGVSDLASIFAATSQIQGIVAGHVNRSQAMGPAPKSAIDEFVTGWVQVAPDNSSSSGSGADWWNALGHFDVQVAGFQDTSGAIEYSFQVRKFYDFDTDMVVQGGLLDGTTMVTLSEFQNLVKIGWAKDYMISSNPSGVYTYP